MTSPADLEAALRDRFVGGSWGILYRDAADFIAHVEQVRRTLTCPTCGGFGYGVDSGGMGGRESCPDCVDGHPSIAALAALWQAVHDDKALDVHHGGTIARLIDHLRSVRAAQPQN